MLLQAASDLKSSNSGVLLQGKELQGYKQVWGVNFIYQSRIDKKAQRYYFT